MEEHPVPSEVVQSFLKNLQKLEEGYPLQYILGEWEFYGHSFYVEEGVLIPRPETELLVDEVLKRLNKAEPAIGIELGVGTGCISITLLIHKKKLKMVGNDINIKALKLAKKNAERHGVSQRFLIFGGSLFQAVKPFAFDFLVSNPPYIPSYLWESLPKALRLEGYNSLIGGMKGWEFYQEVSKELDKYLKKDGFFVFEIGHDQGSVIKEIFEPLGYKVEVHKDYAGQDRVAVGWRL